MAKLKDPFFSFGAVGRLGKAFTVARRLSGPVGLLRGRPTDSRTEPQLSWRTMWQLAAGLWHQLSAAEVREWESAGTRHHMTGFAYYMSQALRPNPGIYLPLAGGDMTGVIDMQGNHVHGLDTPVHISDAANKQYVDWKVREEVTRPSVRTRRTSDQDIDHGTATAIIFDTEDYDNDNLWEGVTNPDRLTIRTEGFYLFIGQVHWSAHATGSRAIYFFHSTAGYISQARGVPSLYDNIARHPGISTWYCLEDEYIEMRVLQSSGAQLQAKADGNQSVVLSAVRIG